ncbi:AAA family ATPase [Paraburkholderia hospita]|nr:AAA family ATPase [Paraburkholderia hospita]
MIFTVGHGKGGVGKSTCAVQIALGLALDGKKVWLVDGDRQQTATSVITVRAETGLPMIAASSYADGATLRAQVTQQAGAYDHVVIDAGGRDSSALRGALTVSDAVLIPFLPRSFDVWALADIASLIEEARAIADLRAFAFINRADPGGSDNAGAAAAVAEYPGIELLSARMADRKAFANACGEGKHVDEMTRRDVKACAEIERVRDEFFSAMGVTA